MRRINGESSAALRMTCVCLRYRSSISKLINALLSPYSHVHWRRLLFGDDAEASFRLHCVVAMQILLQKQPDIHMIWMNSAVIKALSLLLRCNICLPRFFRCVCISRRLIMTSCVFKPHLLALVSFKAV